MTIRGIGGKMVTIAITESEFELLLHCLDHDTDLYEEDIRYRLLREKIMKTKDVKNPEEVKTVNDPE